MNTTNMGAVLRWIQKADSWPSIAETGQPAEEGEALEVDERCRFVGGEERKVGTWTV